MRTKTQPHHGRAKHRPHHGILAAVRYLAARNKRVDEARVMTIGRDCPVCQPLRTPAWEEEKPARTYGADELPPPTVRTIGGL